MLRSDTSPDTHHCGCGAVQVALFSENSSRWLVADQAIMTVGAADAVRGASSPAQEMAYIVKHSESCGIIAQDAATLERLAPALMDGGSTSSSGNGNGSNGSRSSVSHAPNFCLSVALRSAVTQHCVLTETHCVKRAPAQIDR